MKLSGFIIFLSVVLSIYGVVNFYIYRRGILPLGTVLQSRGLVIAVFLGLLLAYPLGRILESYFRNGFTTTLTTVGSFYLAIMVYTFLLLLVLDLAGILLKMVSLQSVTAFLKHWRGGLAVGLAVILTVVGHINALHPVVRQLKVHIPKKNEARRHLRIVMASDIHLGTIIRNSRLEEIVDLINAQKPDLILFPGDLVDEDVAPVAEQKMGQTFQKLQAPLGIYAVTGNHEYFSGVKAAVSYMKEAGVRVLQDQWVEIDSGLVLVGRKDRTAERMGTGRKSLEEVLEGVNPQKTIILMDHQPFHLEEAEQNGVDLQLSGHTHHGQLFPFNWITNRVYEKSWGYHRRGTTQYYVSCGVGTWGPPVRLGNRPEIVVLELEFE
ncbi:MAG: metallophosphoesterase [Calditrichia bacterium]